MNLDMVTEGHVSAEGAVDSPRVSVVVIAYNEQERIVDCVNSIVRQSFKDCEIIVVDDGSKDATVTKLRTTLPEEKRLRIVELGVNQGRGAARLAGINAARGELIGFVDADIVLPASWLETLVGALPGHSAVSGIAVPDGDCAVVWRLFKPAARVHVGSEQITGNNVLFIGDVIRKVGFDASSRLGEDFRLASRLRSLGHKLATINSVTVEHREAKSYAAAFRWLYASGVDASSLLVEFGRFRVPDAAWCLWLVGQTSLAATGLASPNNMPVILVSSLLLTSMVAFGHIYSRFDPRSRPLRWLATGLANIPLMFAYLVGRTVGATRLVFRRHYR